MTMEPSDSVLICFPDLPPAASNQAASELLQKLKKITRGRVNFEIQRVDEHSMDAGSVLAIVLGAKAVVSFSERIAGGISNYIARSGSTIEIVTPNGTVVARGEAATNIDTAAVTRALNQNSD